MQCFGWTDYLNTILLDPRVTSALSAKGHFQLHWQDASVTSALQFLTPNVPQPPLVAAKGTSCNKEHQRKLLGFPIHGKLCCYAQAMLQASFQMKITSHDLQEEEQFINNLPLAS